MAQSQPRHPLPSTTSHETRVFQHGTSPNEVLALNHIPRNSKHHLPVQARFRALDKTISTGSLIPMMGACARSRAHANVPEMALFRLMWIDGAHQPADWWWPLLDKFASSPLA